MNIYDVYINIVLYMMYSLHTHRHIYVCMYVYNIYVTK